MTKTKLNSEPSKTEAESRKVPDGFPADHERRLRKLEEAVPMGLSHHGDRVRRIEAFLGLDHVRS